MIKMCFSFQNYFGCSLNAKYGTFCFQTYGAWRQMRCVKERVGRRIIGKDSTAMTPRAYRETKAWRVFGAYDIFRLYKILHRSNDNSCGLQKVSQKRNKKIKKCFEFVKHCRQSFRVIASVIK